MCVSCAKDWRARFARAVIFMAAIALACLAAWLSFWPLALMGILPLWLGCAITSVFAAGGYAIGHEAMHSNIGQEGTKRRFWNELTGQLSTILLILPFSMVKIMHLLHHQHTNDPDKDPDAIHAAPNAAMAFVPKISIGIDSGRMRTGAISPPRLSPTVTAAPMAPRATSPGVPRSSAATVIAQFVGFQPSSTTISRCAARWISRPCAPTQAPTRSAR